MKKIKRIAVVGLMLALSLPLSAQTNLSIDQLKNAYGQSGTTATSGTGVSGLGSQGAASSGAVTSAFGSGANTLLGQTQGSSTLVLPDVNSRALIAMSTEAYPATPGDVYSLSFLKAYQPEQLTLVVGGDGLINTGIFGTFDTRGKTFRQVKAQIEKKVLDSYPASTPSLLIASTGLFPVTVSGEVTVTTTITVWGLTRLSEAVSAIATPYSSIRDVVVVSAGGKRASCDLFAALRGGDLSQDPYVQPLDTVIVNRASRMVSISGEIRRPGTYQLLPGEGLADLVNRFASGMQAGAKTDRVLVTRKAATDFAHGESLVVDFLAAALPELRDGDMVKIPSGEDYLPVVYIEGAVGTNAAQSAQNASSSAATGSGTPELTMPATAATPVAVKGNGYLEKRVVWRKGLSLFQALEPVADDFPADADLRNAFLVHVSDKSVIRIDLEKLLHAFDPALDIELSADDRIVIPFKTPSVFVSGEVKRAGFVSVTGSERLSGVLKPYLLPRSSLRRITVTSAEGKEIVVDLFRAERFGLADQDPILRPGDRIRIEAADRLVEVSGEVRRPGNYELLDTESLAELLATLCAGTLESAQTDRVLVTHHASAGKPSGESLVVDTNAPEPTVLRDGDSVRVPSREEYLPVVYIEGAVEKADKTAGANAAAAGTEKGNLPKDAYFEKRIVWRKDLLLSQMIAPLIADFSESADLYNAYLVRALDRSVLHIDLDRLLFAHDLSLDTTLESGDRIVIPFKIPSVFVSGEVTKAGFAVVSGIERLSEVVKPLLTPYSSTRRIVVTSAEGKENVYDLFLAERSGDASQNPILRPGDKVAVARADRIVALSGEVNRPGTYELLRDEGLSDLLSVSGGGVREFAQSEKILVTRKASEGEPSGEILVVDALAPELPVVHDGDTVRVPSREEYLPVVYVEGAVGGASVAIKADMAEGNADRVAQGSYSVLRVTYRKGQLLSQALKPLGDSISGSADLKRAFVTRKGRDEPIAVDLEKLLYAYNPADDLELQAEDRVVIPFGAMYVYVTGEVTKTSWVGVTGLTRLREALAPLVTNYSSLRDVAVKSEDGSEKRYDLFKAERYGELTQDPYLRPGDVVTLRKSERVVTLAGEVHRPGRYELLAGEGLSELLKLYGDGILETGRADLAVVTRKTSGANPESGVMLFDAGTENLPELSDGDSVRVPSREEYLPVVYIEGAVEKADKTAAANAAAAGTEKGNLPKDGYFEKRIVWRKGLLLSRMIAPLIADFSESADLYNAYLVRALDRSVLRIDLDRLLFAHDPSIDVTLEAGDRIVIPFKIPSVFVSGEVTKAGFAVVSGIERLSEVVKPLLTPYSSTRRIVVASAEGKENVYDLFLAERSGDASQNPILRPGDKVAVARADRIVALSGEVNRPGTYELLRDEGLSDLLSVSGGGVFDSAQADRVVVTRKATEKRSAGEVIVVDARSGTAGSSLPELFDGDTVRVPSRDEYLPVVYIEGAVAGEKVTQKADKAVQQTQASDYSVLRIAWRSGMRLSDALRPMRDSIPASADLKNAFVTKSSAAMPIQVNLEKILYTYDLSFDIALEPEDRVIIPLGSMYVFVTGEVSKSSWVGITGLTRLREAVTPLLTRWSSVRDVKILSENGAEQSYDLFSAERYGDLSQDPFLRPGDKVSVERLGRLVAIAGEVRRPGSYQLLAGEGMKELVDRYADGFTEKANPTRMQVVRFISGSSTVGEKLQFDYSASPDFALNQYDSITVPAWQDLLPVAWFEGAIGVGAEGTTLQSAQRMAFTFYPGETVSQAAQTLRKSFSEVSDLSNSYISRKGKRIPVDLARFLYDRDDSGDMRLEANDVIVVPFRQFFVSVSGAVQTPGRYPYVPDRTWEYYIGLAGGFDTERNANSKIEILDVSAKPQLKDRVIQPEDNIIAASNSFLYSFYRVSSIITVILSVASLIFALVP